MDVIHPKNDQEKGVKSSLITIALTVIIYFASQYAAVFIVLLYPLIQHWSASQSSTWLMSSVIAQFFNILLVESFVIIMLRFILHKMRSSFQAIGWNRGARLKDFGYILIGFGIYFSLLTFLIFPLIQHLVPAINLSQKQELGFSAHQHGLATVLIFISLVILPPIVEETLVRGFLYTGLRKNMNKVFAAILISIIFAIAHLQIGSGNPLLWAAAVDTFVLSLVLVYIREATGSLWASAGIHMLKNGLAFIALFVIR
ncbi:MAG: hypothetical protein NVSMB46_09130 [Candidatus Saccharimonadales bacterium]